MCYATLPQTFIGVITFLDHTIQCTYEGKFIFLGVKGTKYLVMLLQSCAHFESSLGVLWNFSLGFLDFFFWPVFLTWYASTCVLFFFHSDLAVETPVMCMFEVENLSKGPKRIHKQIHAYINTGSPVGIGQRCPLFDWMKFVGKETLK